MASTSDDHSARSPTRTRSDSSSQAAASRQPVMLTMVYACPLPWDRRRYHSSLLPSDLANAGR